MGRYGGARGYNSSPGIFRSIWRTHVGRPTSACSGMIIPVVIYMYYVYIEAWCLGYAWDYLAGTDEFRQPTRLAYEAFFNQFVGHQRRRRSPVDPGRRPAGLGHVLPGVCAS